MPEWLESTLREQLSTLRNLNRTTTRGKKVEPHSPNHSKRPKIDYKRPKLAPQRSKIDSWKQQIYSQIPKIESQTKSTHRARYRYPRAKNQFSESLNSTHRDKKSASNCLKFTLSGQHLTPRPQNILSGPQIRFLYRK